MGSGPCPWGQLKSKFILGYKLSYLSQCRAPAAAEPIIQLVQSHLLSGLFLAQGLMELWSVVSCPGGVLCLRQPPIACGSTYSKGWGVQVEGGMLAGFWRCLGLGCVRAACGATLGGFASSHICSPGGTNPGCCTELGEKSYQKCQLCDICCGTAEPCFHCCLTLCQHYFWKAV